MHDKLDTYLQDVVRSVCSILHERVSAVSVGGSIAFADFHPGMSDVDIALFLDRTPSPAQFQALVRELDHRILPCPGKGLDLMGFGRSLRMVPPAPEALFGYVTGPTWRTELTGRETDPDFLIDLYVHREHGQSVYGIAPHQVIGPIEKKELRPLLVRVVTWHRTQIHDAFHDPTGAFAVLNACRAWRFLVDGVMGSKTAGGVWAGAHRPDLKVIDSALALRRGDRTDRLDKREVLRFLDIVDIEITKSTEATQIT